MRKQAIEAKKLFAKDQCIMDKKSESIHYIDPLLTINHLKSININNHQLHRDFLRSFFLIALHKV